MYFVAKVPLIKKNLQRVFAPFAIFSRSEQTRDWYWITNVFFPSHINQIFISLRFWIRRGFLSVTDRVKEKAASEQCLGKSNFPANRNKKRFGDPRNTIFFIFCFYGNMKTVTKTTFERNSKLHFFTAGVLLTRISFKFLPVHVFSFSRWYFVKNSRFKSLLLYCEKKGEIESNF